MKSWRDQEGTRLSVQIKTTTEKEEFLETELLLGGVDISGTNPQRHVIGETELTYRWNCNFPMDTSDKKATLVFRHVTEENSTEIGTVSIDIKVKRLDHLSHRTVLWLAGVAALITVIGVTVSTAKTIHDWNIANTPEATAEVTQQP